ncbi:MAG: helix-turn-helix domain-containing protein [Candidatus Bathyarchaeota archaeon]|nr:helix-turn-helix domain-containing protein [Candidatus Bathyarchaeota archaeon]
MIEDDEVIESELKGKTLLVYMYLIRSRKPTVGVREVQRALGFSSPSVSSYHLNKLQELGLVASERGDYRLVREVKLGVLRQFVTLGGVMLPRFLFYAVLVTTMLLTYLYQFPFRFERQYVTTLLLGAVPAVVLWYETARIWRDRPR